MKSSVKPAPATEIAGNFEESEDGHEIGLRVRPAGLDLSSRYLVHADGRALRVDVIPPAAPEEVWAEIVAGATSRSGLVQSEVIFLGSSESGLREAEAGPVVRLRNRLAERGWCAAGDVDFGSTWEPRLSVAPLSRLERAELAVHGHLHALAWALSRLRIVRPATMASLEWRAIPDIMCTRASRSARYVANAVPANVTALIAGELLAGEIVRALIRNGFRLSSTQWRHVGLG